MSKNSLSLKTLENYIIFGKTSMRFCSSLQKDSDSQQYPPEISRTMSFVSRETNDRFEASNDNEYGNRKGTKDRFEASNEAGNETINDNLNDTLTPTEKTLIRAIETSDKASLARLTKITGLSRSTVIRNLQRLVESGKVVREGAKKNGRWKIV